MTSQNETETLMTVPEVAAVLRLNPATVYAMAESGELPSIRVGLSRGRIRVSRTALNQWIAEAANANAPAHAAAAIA